MLSLISLVGALATIAFAQSDVEKLYQRRLPFILQTYPPSANPEELMLEEWAAHVSAEGTWDDVDYTAGCDARRANWPAQQHWFHVIPLAAYYAGLFPPDFQLAYPDELPPKLNTAIDWWFNKDYTDSACQDQGGLTNNTCPCGTPGLWNPNWFSNTILIPRQTVQTCLILNATITEAQRAKCIEMSTRAWGLFDKFIYGLGYLTGANTLDVSSTYVNAGILMANSTGEAVIDAGYEKIHSEVVIQNGLMVDGIRPDGSFGQHIGVLYNGNYGKDYLNLIVSLEIPAADTKWEAGPESRNAVDVLLEGSAWMIYRNTLTNVLHWDISTVGRFLGFPVADRQATGSINLNLPQIQQLGEQWNDTKIQHFATSLQANSTVNAGNLVGNKMFYTNDYMVHRGENYVTTVKMISKRTSNNECLNNQNPYGFYLGQGAVWNYVTGNEYEDTPAAWDWTRIPGVTVDHLATPLSCNFTQWTGNRTFVGGASDGKIGVAAMDYLNPYTGGFRYRKAWFFFGQDVQHVVVSGIKSQSDAPVLSVLDQKRLDGPVYINGQEVTTRTNDVANATSFYNGGVGYTFDSRPAYKSLRVEVTDVQGDWKLIGTSTQKPVNVTMIQSWVEHDMDKVKKPLSYTVYPGSISNADFETKRLAKTITSVADTTSVYAAADIVGEVVMAVFWSKRKGGSVVVPWGTDELHIGANKGAIVILNVAEGKVTVSDPTQKTRQVSISIKVRGHVSKKRWATCFGRSGKKTLHFNLPSGPTAGDSVTQDLC